MRISGALHLFLGRSSSSEDMSSSKGYTLFLVGDVLGELGGERVQMDSSSSEKVLKYNYILDFELI